MSNNGRHVHASFANAKMSMTLKFTNILLSHLNNAHHHIAAHNSAGGQSFSMQHARDIYATYNFWPCSVRFRPEEHWRGD